MYCKVDLVGKNNHDFYSAAVNFGSLKIDEFLDVCVCGDTVPSSQLFESRYCAVFTTEKDANQQMTGLVWVKRFYPCNNSLDRDSYLGISEKKQSNFRRQSEFCETTSTINSWQLDERSRL